MGKSRALIKTSVSGGPFVKKITMSGSLTRAPDSQSLVTPNNKEIQHAISGTAQGRRTLRIGRAAEPGADGEDGTVHGGDHESRRSALHRRAPAELEGRPRSAL